MFHFDISGLKEHVSDLERASYEEDFWKDTQKAQEIMQDIKGSNNSIKAYEDLLSEIDDLEIYIEMVIEEDSYELIK